MPKLPVLLYHKVAETTKLHELTVDTRQLEQHFRHLSRKGFTPILLSDLIAFLDQAIPLPAKPVLITFDDGYKNNFTKLYPLLIKYNFKAVIFLTAGFIQTGDTDSGTDYLHSQEIGQMRKDIVEYGLHTLYHKSYDELSLEQIEEDIDKARQRLHELKINIQPCLAYTFGAFPRKDKKKRNNMFEIFEKKGIRLAFRIGNRINSFPPENKFLLQRIDTNGGDSLWKFKLMCRFGRKWLPF